MFLHCFFQLRIITKLNCFISFGIWVLLSLGLHANCNCRACERFSTNSHNLTWLSVSITSTQLVQQTRLTIARTPVYDYHRPSLYVQNKSLNSQIIKISLQKKIIQIQSCKSTSCNHEFETWIKENWTEKRNLQKNVCLIFDICFVSKLIQKIAMLMTI